MTDRRWTPRQLELIADMLDGKLREHAPEGLAWVLLVAEPGQPGSEARSVYGDRASVAAAIRATLEAMGDA